MCERRRVCLLWVQQTRPSSVFFYSSRLIVLQSSLNRLEPNPLLEDRRFKSVIQPWSSIIWKPESSTSLGFSNRTPGCRPTKFTKKTTEKTIVTTPVDLMKKKSSNEIPQRHVKIHSVKLLSGLLQLTELAKLQVHGGQTFRGVPVARGVNDFLDLSLAVHSFLVDAVSDCDS